MGEARQGEAKGELHLAGVIEVVKAVQCDGKVHVTRREIRLQLRAPIARTAAHLYSRRQRMAAGDGRS